jgi:dolichyl-phosphate-mannose--protein O-mannosyl transferase
MRYAEARMGIELELSVLLFLSVVGLNTFVWFSIEVPAWRKILKWVALTAITLGLYRVVGHWALGFLAILVVVGIPVHVAWCRRRGIDPIRATPLRKYYEAQGWPWPEKFR